VGFCGIFGHFSTPEQNPALEVLSTPAHPQVTQTVGTPLAKLRSSNTQKEYAMSKIVLGIICGVVFGAISVATMIPLTFEDKKAAMTGAFVSRFGVGFVIGATNLPFPTWISGLLFGILLSLPDAIITKAWIPIMGLGIIGGIVCGLVIGSFGI
jgi:hypothetical protein